MAELTFIDLFAGAGGLSEGFIQAGFHPVAHVEIDSHACNTIETRLVYHKLRAEDKLDFYYDYLNEKDSREKFISKFGDKYLSDSVLNIGIGDKNNDIIFRKIDELADNNEIDVIIGGPPCQAYSLIGRSRDENGMKDDPRNFLYKEYAKFLKNYRPKVFVFENVLGLKTADNGKYLRNMQAYFRRIGYNLKYEEQNSENFGVLQKRKRIILIGWRKDLEFTYPLFEKIEHNYVIKDILSDLKSLKPGEQNRITRYKKSTTAYLDNFNIRNGVDFVSQHIARPHNERDLKIYEIAIKNFLKNGNRLKYSDLPEELKTHKNEKFFLDRFKVVNPNGLAHTMVAHISKDGHHYIYPDQKQIRSISVREAARIQSFPDDFYFEGGRTNAFKQIGNAVPPLMAFAIAQKLKTIF